MSLNELSYKPAIAAGTDLLASDAVDCVIIVGQPGIGKTAIAPYVQKNLALEHRYMVKPGHHEPYDFHGLPVPHHETKQTFFYPSGDLLPPQDLKGGCLFVLDEGLDATTPIQNLECQLIFEKGLHCYMCPEQTKFIITGNRVSDRSGAQRMLTKLGNRAAIITLKPTVQELFDYGVSQDWAPSVLAFLKLRGDDQINPNDRKTKDNEYLPTFFNSFDPNDPAQGVMPIFASSRTWEATSNLIKYVDKINPNMSDVDLLARVTSLVSAPVATALVPFRSESLTMPDPDAIARGQKVAHPKKTSVMWVLTLSLVSRATKENFENIYAWLDKGGNREFAILFIKQCFDTKATKLISPAFNRVLQLEDVKQALSAT